MRKPDPDRDEEIRKRRRAKRIGMVVFVFLLMASAFIVSISALDERGQQWVTCDIAEAKVTRGSNHSPYPWFLKIDSQRCGTIFYTEVTDQQEVEELAKSVEPGEYEFLMGQISRLNLDYYVPFARTNAHDFRAFQRRSDTHDCATNGGDPTVDLHAR